MKKAFSVIFGALFSTLLFAALPVSASVNDFTIDQYDIRYTLSRDTDNRSTLITEETIVANFPNADQNHGIERYIPKDYDGHSTSLEIHAVTDQNGSSRNYTTYTSSDYEVLRIGDKNTYLRGKQTFTVRYTQRDVTKYFSDTSRSEFYWDTNGTAWRVPIKNLSVSLAVDDSIRQNQSGKVACYQGQFNESNSCAVFEAAGSATIEATNLAIGENVTLAVGFEPETFAAYQMSLLEKVFIGWIAVQILCFIMMLIIIFFLAHRYEKWSHRKKELGTIVPEYVPPRDTSIQASSSIVGSKVSFGAQLIDLAVRHYVRIYETKAKGTFSKAEYEIEIVKDVNDLHAEEIEFLNDIFSGQTGVGSKVGTKELQKDYGLAGRLLDNPKKLQILMRSKYGLQHRDEVRSRWFKKFSIVVFCIGLPLLSPPLFVAALVAFVMRRTLWPLTDKGLELYRYLEGLKMYIGVAEVDRLKMLQSPEGAAKAQVDGSDQKQLVKLYERVLPYAMLFGQEKEWNKQLGEYYETTSMQPDWYTGTTLAAFSAVNFSSAMNNLTASISSTGASSSSSGGSGGGGFSGGGGGGGGGGGW